MINQLDDRYRPRTGGLAGITLLLTALLMAGCDPRKGKSTPAKGGAMTSLATSDYSSVSPKGTSDLEFEDRLGLLKKGMTSEEIVNVLGSEPNTTAMSGTGPNPSSRKNMEMYLIYERKDCSYDVVVDGKKQFVTWRKSSQ